MLKYPISRNSVQWESSITLRADGRTHGRTKTKTLAVTFRNISNASKSVSLPCLYLAHHFSVRKTEDRSLPVREDRRLTTALLTDSNNETITNVTVNTAATFYCLEPSLLLLTEQLSQHRAENKQHAGSHRNKGPVPVTGTYVLVIHSKGKVFIVHVIKISRNGGTAPRILNLRSKWRWGGLFYAWGRSPCTWCKEVWTGCRAGLEFSKKRKISCSFRESNHDFSVVQPVA